MINANGHYWFNSDCRERKAEFYYAKRMHKANPSVENLDIFICARNQYCSVKRNAKRKLYNDGKSTSSSLSNLTRENFGNT